MTAVRSNTLLMKELDYLGFKGKVKVWLFLVFVWVFSSTNCCVL